MRVELFKDDDKRLRRRGIIHGWLKPFLFAAALTFLAVLASHGAEETPRKADYIDPVTGMEFVLVKGGEFEIVRGPCTEYRENVISSWCGYFQHYKDDTKFLVRVSDFYLGRYEVTQAQWVKVMGKKEPHFNGDDRPVFVVSWEDAQEFLRRLNVQTNGKFRLPTEAEWEYAARGGGGKDTWSGTSLESELGEYAWLRNERDSAEGPTLSDISLWDATKPVGGKKPNILGLYDMTGNVMEWVLDGHLLTLAGGQKQTVGSKEIILNPVFNYAGNYRVLKGGSWCFGRDMARSAWRHLMIGRIALDDFGFRVALPATGGVSE